MRAAVHLVDKQRTYETRATRFRDFGLIIHATDPSRLVHLKCRRGPEEVAKPFTILVSCVDRDGFMAKRLMRSLISGNGRVSFGNGPFRLWPVSMVPLQYCTVQYTFLCWARVRGPATSPPVQYERGGCPLERDRLTRAPVRACRVLSISGMGPWNLKDGRSTSVFKLEGFCLASC